MSVPSEDIRAPQGDHPREARPRPAKTRLPLRQQRQCQRDAYTALNASRAHTAAMAAVSHELNIALAGLQLLIGYEWLVSGGDKLLYGRFPAQLGTLLAGLLTSGRVPTIFAVFLRTIVLPHAVLFGLLIEWGETLAGLCLVTAGIVNLVIPLVERRLRDGWDGHDPGRERLAAMWWYGLHLLDLLVPLAAVATGLLGVSFYILNGLRPFWFVPDIAYGGAVDTSLLMAFGSGIVLICYVLHARYCPRQRVIPPSTSRAHPRPERRWSTVVHP
jgi:hypothetical protein